MCQNRSKNLLALKLKDSAKKWNSPKKPLKNSPSSPRTNEWFKPTTKDFPARVVNLPSLQPPHKKCLGKIKGKVQELWSLKHNIRRWHLRRRGGVVKVARWWIKPQHQTHITPRRRKKENYQSKVLLQRLWVKRMGI